MDSGVSLADIAAVTDKTNGMFGGADGGMWIFASNFINDWWRRFLWRN